MPCEIRLSVPARTAEIHAVRTVTGPDIIDTCRTLFRHPDWEPGFSTLWITEELRSLVVSLDDVAAFRAEAPEFARLRGGGRTAVVSVDVYAEQIALLLGLKLAEAPGGAARSLRLFETTENARAWLGTAPSTDPEVRPEARSGLSNLGFGP
jgi:hypothetical protein